MVKPIHGHRVPSQPSVARPQPSEIGKSSQVFSPGDLQALRRRIKPASQDGASTQDHDEKSDAEAQAAEQTRAASSRKQGQAQKRAGRQAGRTLSRPQTDRSFSRPPGEFDVQPAVNGSTVLVSADGKILHNLQGPVAKAIYDYLCSTCPRTERPTVWLDALFGRVPIKALQGYLDQVDANEGNAIFVSDDGHLDVGTMQNTAPNESCVYVVKRTDPA